jgi:hypothetical protein
MVTTVLLEMSATNNTALIDGVTQNIQNIQNPGTTTKTGLLQYQPVVNFLLSTPLYDYTGSVTTPPCAEGVRILIASQPLPLSVANYLALKNVLKFNSRYTQNAIGQPNLLSVAADDLKTLQGGSPKSGSPTSGGAKSGSAKSGASLIPVLSLLSFIIGYMWL